MNLIKRLVFRKTFKRSLEYLNYSEEYSVLKDRFLKTANNVNCIILGSSHARRNFVSEIFSENSFNFGTTSQDLYESYKFLEYSCRLVRKLEKVILFISAFSGGFNIQHSGERFRAAIVEHVFEICPQEKYDLLCEFLKYNLSNNHHHSLKIQSYADQYLIGNSDAINLERVYKHKEYSLSNQEILWLNEIIKFCKERGIDLTLVSSPCKKIYREIIPSETAFANIENICKSRNVRFLNFYHSSTLKEEDFYDLDHLNIDGARRLTEEIIRNI